MSDESLPDGPGKFEYLDFISPLSWPRAEHLATRLATSQPGRVLDVGCGWGELLLQILRRAETSVGVGVDSDGLALERARSNATSRGLDGRVTFVTDINDPHVVSSEVVICSGASHVFGTPAEALQSLHQLVSPGGRLLFAEGFWDRSAPVGGAAVPDDMKELPGLADLVDIAIGAGFRPLCTETATRAEWETFENGYLADLEYWLMTHPHHTDTDSVRRRADEHRNRWLRGYYDALGYAYLTLGRPVDP